MARYVLVDADGIDMTIKYGPIELEDPSQYSVPEGNQLMLESVALSEGYRYAEGGAAFAPEDPSSGEGDEDDRPGRGRRERDDDGDDRRRQGGDDGSRGPQGRHGGQGAQVQPGVQDDH
ncbi:hypothetical protein ACLGIH_20125 [Streptomyces sp. HMX87]|uniref:hypothetical protein n=1 Tax=Streptomyces sp. HMX87 TaxID=3390849 RepID=UPI003A87D03C